MAQAGRPDFIEAVLTGSAVASFGVENFGPESLLNVTRKSLDGRIASIRDRLFAADGA